MTWILIVFRNQQVSVVTHYYASFQLGFNWILITYREGRQNLLRHRRGSFTWSIVLTLRCMNHVLCFRKISFDVCFPDMHMYAAHVLEAASNPCSPLSWRSLIEKNCSARELIRTDTLMYAGNDDDGSIIVLYQQFGLFRRWTGVTFWSVGGVACTSVKSLI